jgi:predicted transcriptional regulator
MPCRFGETAEYKDIVSVLRELHVSALPVPDEADHLGVVSEADRLRVVDRPCSEIRAALLKDIIARDFARDPGASVSADDGPLAVAVHPLSAVSDADAMVAVL